MSEPENGKLVLGFLDYVIAGLHGTTVDSRKLPAAYQPCCWLMQNPESGRRAEVNGSMGCLISVSTAPFACLGDKKYYDLTGTIDVMKRIKSESIVDGFELQLEPEWDPERPPLTDGEFADWTTTPKYDVDEILGLLKGENLPILSVHASRDIGNYLCSPRRRDLEKGKNVARDALFLTKALGAQVCVFHLWDTRASTFNLERVRQLFQDVADQFSSVKASVENIPTHRQGATPFALVQGFHHITLDLRWAAIYDELAAFQSVVHKLANVHLRGRLEDKRWVLDRSRLVFYEAVSEITHVWQYEGLLTLEREGTLDSSRFADFAEAMRDLHRIIHDPGAWRDRSRASPTHGLNKQGNKRREGG